MFTERDEANYHEMFVHVPLAVSHDVGSAVHTSPEGQLKIKLKQAKHVLIIGGGDGGVLSRLVHYQVLGHVLPTHVALNFP